MSKQLFTLLFFCLVFINVVKPQKPTVDNPFLKDLNPKAPNTAELLKYIDFNLGSNSGVPNIAIPLYNVEGSGISLPIEISYDASGIKVNQTATNVGLAWSLSAGGFISQRIRGQRDNSTYYPTVASKLTGFPLRPYDLFGDYNFADNVTKGVYDGEPDIYSYSFNGISGQFLDIIGRGNLLIPKRELLIEKYGTSAYNGVSFIKITTEDGTKYYFEDLEVSNIRTVNSTQTESYTWHLSKIESANGNDFISLKYVDTYFEEFPNLGESYSFVSLKGCPPPAPIQNASMPSHYYSTKTFIRGKQLKSIEYRAGKIDFELSNNREDLFGDLSKIYNPKIDRIVVKNTSGDIIKAITFNYSYYNAGSSVAYAKRLKLDGVSICPTPSDCGNPDLTNTYRFSYNSIPLPPIDSKSQDFWGYYNGQKNNTLIPNYPFQSQKDINFTTKPFCLGGAAYMNFKGANKDANPNYSKAGILEKIEYPTGGYTQFEYESHVTEPKRITTGIDRDIFITLADNQKNNGVLNSLKSGISDKIPDDQPNYVGTVGVCGMLKLNYGYPSNTDPLLLNHWKPYGVVYEINDANGSVVPIFTLYMDGTENEKTASLTMRPGYKYQVEVFTKLLGSTITGRINYSFPTEVDKTYLLGGLRLKKKYVNDGTSNTMFTSYDYFDIAYKDYEKEYQVTNLEFLEVNTTCGDPIVAGANSNPSGNVGGRINFNYNLVLNGINGGVPAYINYGQIKTTYGISGENGYKYVKYLTVDEYNLYKKGQVLNEKVYDNYDNLRSETINVYHETLKENFPGIAIRSMSINPHVVNNQSLFLKAEKYIDFKINPNLSVWNRLISSVNKTYSPGNSNCITTQTNYGYDNAAHKQITSTTTLNSDGTKYITRMRYPQDYTGGNVAQDEFAINISDMASDNIHQINTVIEKISSVVKPGQSTELVTGAVLMKYKKFNNNQYLPYQQYALETNTVLNNFTNSVIDIKGNLNYDKRYSLLGTILNYNILGNPIATQKPQEVVTTIQYDNTRRLPVAVTINANEGEVVSNSFEGYDGEGFTNVNLNVINSNDAHTGLKSLQVSAGNPAWGPYKLVELNSTSQTKKYKISAWVKTPVNFGKFVMAIQTFESAATTYIILPQNNWTGYEFTSTNGNWQYIEKEFDLNLARINGNIPSNVNLGINFGFYNTDANNTFLIDDIQFAPSNSVTKTHTWDNRDRIVTTSNEAGQFQRFEYDALDRLSIVKDQNGAILQYKEYQFKNINSAQNYVKVTSPLASVTTIAQLNALSSSDKTESITYLDGIGRPIQKVDKAISSISYNDIITPIVYDAFGRNDKNYLSYVANQNTGAYRSNAIAEQYSFYTTPSYRIPNTIFPYSENAYDGSPLNFIYKQSLPGDNWSIQAFTTNSFSYATNTAGSISEPDIRLFELTTNGEAVSTNVWPTNTLMKHTSRDPNGSTNITYTDAIGRTIASLQKSGTNTYLCTYNVYDDFGNIALIIPPKALAWMNNNNNYNTAATGLAGQDLLFRNVFDSRKRLIEKKVPGSGWEHYVYSPVDKPVLTQTANQRAKNEWSFIKYDALDRPIITGVFDASANASLQSRNNIQSYINGLSNVIWYEEPTGDNYSTQMGYSNLAFPTQNTTLLTLNYYDTYDLDKDGYSEAVYDNTPITTLQQTCPGTTTFGGNSIVQNASILTKGKATISYTYVESSHRMLSTNMFYNDLGRLIQVQSKDAMGNNNLLNSVYDFNGRVLNTQHKHTTNANGKTLQILNTYTYNKAGRLMQEWQKTDRDIPVLISKRKYNELGMLAENNLHATSYCSNPLQSVDYSYNIQGWLTGINSVDFKTNAGNDDVYDLWGMELNYDVLTTPGGTPQYNGNISKKRWASLTDKIIRSYTFSYDMVNRLTNAVYSEIAPTPGPNPNTTTGTTTPTTGRMSALVTSVPTANIKLVGTKSSVFLQDVSLVDVPRAIIGGTSVNNLADKYTEGGITYDENGNILTLSRNGYYAPGLFDNIDKLTYTYNGNQLLSVTDNAVQTAFGFIDGNKVGNDYVYDDNGSIIEDKNKSIKTTYNRFNLPEIITFTGNRSVKYFYDGAGHKIQKQVNNNGSISNIFYCGKFVYNDNGLDYFFTSEGRAVNTAGNFRYEYQFKDQTGNVMLTFSDLNNDGVANTTEIIQQTNYYALGSIFEGTGYSQIGAVNPYMHDGKELQMDFGINLCDYGKRHYDPLIGRWIQVDGKSVLYNSLSPYSYVGNNPLKYVEKDGEVFGTILGAIIGGVTAAVQGKNVWKGAAAGAIAGAAADLVLLTGGTAAVFIAAGVVGGAVGSAADQVIVDGKDLTQIDMQKVALSGAVGGVLGGASYGIGKFFTNTKIGQSIAGSVNKAATRAGSYLRGAFRRSSVEIESPIINFGYDVATKADEAFFWSGKTKGIGGAEKAQEIAKQKGGVTLESLMEQRNIKMPSWDINDPVAVEAWGRISEEYASQVSGKVRAVIGENLRDGNIWQNKELPALMNNKNVTEIITIDPASGAEKTIFKR